MAFGARVLNRG